MGRISLVQDYKASLRLPACLVLRCILFILGSALMKERTTYLTGQWMTERPGGSDVSRTESVATYDPGHKAVVKASDGSDLGYWRIDGF